jgi:hypothetical protein
VAGSTASSSLAPKIRRLARNSRRGDDGAVTQPAASPELKLNPTATPTPAPLADDSIDMYNGGNIVINIGGFNASTRERVSWF